MNLIKVPLASLNLNKNTGCQFAPSEIIKQLQNFCLTESGLQPSFQIKEIPLDKENIEESFRKITEEGRKFFQTSPKNIFLGGDHAITFPLMKAFTQIYPSSCLILFDAHPDCQSDFQPPTHEDFIVSLIKNQIIKKENLLLVGLRNWSLEEYRFLKQNQIKFFTMGEIALEGLFEISEAIMSFAKNFSSLYLSIDIDVLDPAFAPGTGYLEPGGLTTRELLFFLYRLKKLKNFKAVDLVEINPQKDKYTSLVGAKIVAELF